MRIYLYMADIEAVLFALADVPGMWAKSLVSASTALVRLWLSLCMAPRAVPRMDAEIACFNASFRRSIDHMSDDSAVTHEPLDAAEAVVPYIPVIIPAAGAVMMFLLAFIAVNMA